MWEKLKSLLRQDQVFYSSLVILVGFISFGLGRLSINDNTTPVSIPSPTVTYNQATLPLAVAAASNTPPKSAKTFVASKTGKRYHLPECPGAKQIKPDNQITFNSSSEAEAAGYTPASNCPGLK